MTIGLYDLGKGLFKRKNILQFECGSCFDRLLKHSSIKGLAKRKIHCRCDVAFGFSG